MFYYTIRRPAGIGAVPLRGIKNIETFRERKEFDFCQAWSKVEYDRELSKEELRAYEMDDNTPKTSEYVDLIPYDPVLIFHGTEEEIKNTRKKEERNLQTLSALYQGVLSGDIDYIFTTANYTRNGQIDSYVHALTHSGKYHDGLQLTSMKFTNGEYVYMTCDSHIRNQEDFFREFGTTPGKRIYYHIA